MAAQHTPRYRHVGGDILAPGGHQVALEDAADLVGVFARWALRTHRTGRDELAAQFATDAADLLVAMRETMRWRRAAACPTRRREYVHGMFERALASLPQQRNDP